MSFRKFLLPLFLLFATLPSVSAFAEPNPLAEQVRTADVILRVVVVSYDALEINKSESHSFQAIAKCRVIGDYKGNYNGKKFIYIPFDYNVDPQPSAIDIEGDYVVMLEMMDTVPIGHPVSWDAVHPVEVEKVKNPEDSKQMIPLEEFVNKIKDTLVRLKDREKETNPLPDDGEKK